jgi:recombination protein RecA
MVTAEKNTEATAKKASTGVPSGSVEDTTRPTQDKSQQDKNSQEKHTMNSKASENARGAKASTDKGGEKSGADKESGAKGAKGSRSSSSAKAVQDLINQNAALKTTLQQIERQFGEGAIMPLGQAQQMKIECIPTGSLSLDIALGGQGIPRGRIAEVYGPESSGKTTLALHIIAQAQRNGGIAAFIDAEHAMDPSWAKKLGVQLETLLISQPNSGEEAMHICEMLIKSNAVDVIVIDSVAALIPKQELEGDIGDSHVGLQARLMSQSMRKLTGAIAKSKSAVIFINQIREKIGVMFGSPETTPGGRALKFYSSVRLDVRRIGQLKDGEEVVGQRVRTKVVKNKVAPPFRVAEFDMMHTNGISYEGDVLDLAVLHKIVTRSGSWFRYGDVQLGQGKEKTRTYLVENPELTEELREKVMQSGGYVGVADGEAAATEEPA